MKYLLVTDGTWGDTLPFIFLAKELIKNNQEVLLLTNEYYEEYIKKENIPFQKTTTIEDRNKFLSNKDLWDPYKGMGVIGQYSGVIFEKSINILEKINPKEITMVIAHAFVYSAKTHCEMHNIPYSCLLISPIQIKSTYRLPIFYGGKNFNFIPQKIKSFVYPFIDKFILDPKFDKKINQYRIKNNLKPIKSFVFWSTISNITLALWPEWYSKKELDYPDFIKFCNFPKKVELFLDKHTDDEIITWIKSGQKPILVTLGSGYLHGQQMLQNLEKLSSIYKKRIIFIGPKENNTDFTNKYIISEKHLSLSKILPLCSIAIHHGGAGTTAQVIKSGIPHIVIPQSHDQPDNAWHIRNNHFGEIIWNQCPDEKILNEFIEKIEKSKKIQTTCLKAKTIVENQKDGIENATQYILDLPPQTL